MSSNLENPLLEAVLRYASQGLKVIPLRPRDKAPILSDWPAKATTDAATIAGWWHQHPDANVGLVCGDLLVLDVDGAPGSDSLTGIGLDPQQLPATWVAETGRAGGQHFYFKNSLDEFHRNRIGVLDGVDIKGVGGYVVAPPSVHPNGNPYKWQAGRAPWEVELAEPPKDFLQLLEGRDQRSEDGDGHQAHDHETRKRFDTARALAGVPEGQRDETIFKLASRLRNADVPREMAEALVLKAARNCQPPFPENTALEKVARAYEGYKPLERETDQRNTWSKAKTAFEFIEAGNQEPEWSVERLISPSAITVLASPRGLGKTHFALKLAVATALNGNFLGRPVKAGRVLLIDRDNPKREIRRRLIGWGGGPTGERFKVLTRDDAPPLTDARAWRDFPFADYELVVLDSLSASSEGVDEKEGGATGKAIAPLLDLARRGAAVLVLANTRKDGEVMRGSGVIGDRADIVYEVRDATNLALDPAKAVWWECLPPARESDWGPKARRRKRRDDYRLAFVPSKFRIAEEPDPFIVEILLPRDGQWQLREVTRQVEAELALLKGEIESASQQKADAAIEHIKDEIIARPMHRLMKSEAESMLCERGISRADARRLIDQGAGVHWELSGPGVKGKPQVLELKGAAGNSGDK